MLSFGTAGCNLGVQVLPELGNLQVAGSRCPGRVGRSGNRGPCGPGVGLPKRGLYLQRPRGLGRVRDRLRQGMPCRGREDRGGDRRLYLALGTQAVFRGDGRGERRSQGLHGRLLSGTDRLASGPGPGHPAVARAREQRVAGSDQPAHSREERLRGRVETHVRLARRGPGRKTCRCTSRPFIPISA